MTQDLDHVVARFAAPPVTEAGGGALDLMREIMTEERPRPARRVLRWRIAAPTGALLTALVLTVTWLMPTSTASALDIKQQDGYYVIQIKDLYADPESYETQLRSVGLDVSLTVVPATAAFERMVFPSSPNHEHITEIKGIDPPGPCDKLGGCAIGVKIPVGFKGAAQINVGRKARPGERYLAFTRWDAKGEPMYCVAYRNKTVAEVREMLRERGIGIEEFTVTTRGTRGGDYEVRDSVPDSWFVSGGSLLASDVASAQVGPEPLDQEFVDDNEKATDCPAS
ncbi:hypothetical protein [Nonomuraea jiangxiensis]|uniref:Uncharacterized protein n=1 Tax=Nonomuraea jiangxiensis TaxID=633440 RepID=A0A1G9CJU8_9ACTN|nr:hypothetical protein [Nonomuraea jiangxiensis]SDK51836.1 hypothetical protein SAMN05421869_116190 [Nonomuraea jiangxiensis]